MSDRATRHHRRLLLVFKNGAEQVIASPSGFVVSSRDGAITEPGNLGGTLPYLDETTLAAVIHIDSEEDDQGLCPHPTCVSGLQPGQWACREHWNDLSVDMRTLVHVAETSLARQDNERNRKARDDAWAKADHYWRNQLEEEQRG